MIVTVGILYCGDNYVIGSHRCSLMTYLGMSPDSSNNDTTNR